MQKGRGRDAVAFGAVLIAAMWGTWLFFRAELDLGSGWTDGTLQYSDVKGERIRYAVWDTPAPLAGAANEINTEEAESKPALSPDGRWLVFAAGERGLNADLFVAEMVGGEPREPRPLSILNTRFDELAPTFGPDGLYFASDRSGTSFGLDLWRAPYADGVFEPAVTLGSGVNSAADETDPCPVPGTRDILFSSNRPRGARRDFDIYLGTRSVTAEPGEENTGGPRRDFLVERVPKVNTPFDEREPALTADGRTLILASDRDGSLGGFDLFRSFLEEGEWLPPVALVGVNTARSERGPLLSADGFSLYFNVDDARTPSDLWRARSKELFRLPTPALSLGEILGILALFLLALLAWLSKRWRAIDVIYRCVLISLLIHFLMLWYLREVYPETGPVEVARDDQIFRVRLAHSNAVTPDSSRERSGALMLAAHTFEAAESAPSRAESGLERSAAAPTETEMTAPVRPLEAPARREAKRTEERRTETVEAALRDREAPVQRFSEIAPGLAVRAQEQVAAPTPDSVTAPQRANPEATLRLAEPSAVPQVAEHRPDASAQDAAGERSPERLTQSAPQLRASAQNSPRISQPEESFATRSAAAPTLALLTPTVAEAPERQSGSATRRATGSALPVFGSVDLQPDHSSQGELQSERPPRVIPTEAGTPTFQPAASFLTRGDPTVDVRQAHRAPARESTSPASPSFDATAELARSQARPSQAENGTPDRFLASPSTVNSADAIPSLQRLRGLESRPDEAQTSDASTPNRAERRTSTEVPDAPRVGVRSVEDAEPSSASQLPVARRFDPLEHLAQPEPQRFRRADAAVPRPDRFLSRPRAAVAEPSFTPTVVAGPAPERLEPLGPTSDERPQRFEHTPYKNRFGDEKLRALEEFGGGIETERAVAAGLAYLAGIQERNGAWGQRRDFHAEKYRDVRVGKTGLALLAFLGAGHTPDADSEYSGVAERAIEFLLGVQNRAHGHFGDTSSYGHGIATYALAECYALTKGKSLRKPIERGIARILSKQDRRRNVRQHGGWGYYFADDSVWQGDTWPRVSVSAWQVMALESARLAGLRVPDAAFDAARGFLLNTWDSRRAAFRYSHDPNRLNSAYSILPASTPAALFALSLLGVDVNADELEPARRFVLNRAPRRYDYGGSDDFVYEARGNLYFWYYSTLAMFRAGGPEWRRWNTAMKRTLLRGQEENGSWEPLSVYSEFAGDDDDERTYTTAMCVLSLEVYYRYFTPLLIAR